MTKKRAAAAALLAATALTLPGAPASAQSCYYAYYADVPLFWPFYAAAAIVGTAAAIATTPFTFLTGSPYWTGYPHFGCTSYNSPYAGYPPPPGAPVVPPYSGYGYYGPPH